MKQWHKYQAELDDIMYRILDAFRCEQERGEGNFQFVFYPEIEAEVL